MAELDRMAYSFFRKKGLLDPDFVALLAHVVLGETCCGLQGFRAGRSSNLWLLRDTLSGWVAEAKCTPGSLRHL